VLAANGAVQPKLRFVTYSDGKAALYGIKPQYFAGLANNLAIRVRRDGTRSGGDGVHCYVDATLAGICGEH
jgi:hypothetical protein